jgi:hypothetical protein
MPNDMNAEQVQVSNYQSTAILKELSDIKSNLAINSTETNNIKSAIIEIKTDLREIKADFVTRREHNEILKDVSDSKKKVEKLEFWQVKVAAYATAAAIVINYLFKIIK